MKGDRFGIRMSGIAADPVLKTGGEMSRMRIGVDKIGRPETKNIAGKVRSVAVPESDRISAIPRRPDSCTEQKRPAIARTGRVLSVPDCALSGYMRPESCGRLKFEIKGLWKRRSMKS